MKNKLNLYKMQFNLTRKTILFFSILFVSAFGLQAQINTDVAEWTFSIKDKGNGEIELRGDVELDPGWYIYDIKIPEFGPNPTKLEIDEIEGAEKIGDFKVIDSKLISGYDPTFKMTLGKYIGTASFVQRFKVTDKSKFKLEGAIRAQVCDDTDCTPPIPNPFSFSAKDLAKSFVLAVGGAPTTVEPEMTATDPVEDPETIEITELDTASKLENGLSYLWTPVVDKLADFGGSAPVTDQSLIWMFILGMGGGFIALLTPCVWPLIPMTVSFFLKRSKNRAKAIKDAIIYGLSIIVIYVALGMLITIVFGASALNELSTSAIFNLLFFALLVFFAVSFLGAFEITLPASWSNKIDSKADTTTGLISIFFMAFTLALVSFSCTGPVIGTVLVAAANTGALLGPAVVMFGFALALAVPFSLFAIFPSWLESMPKSGGWLNTVKVVLGFLELALALKFFSVADLAYGWGLLDRETFLALWIVIFGLLGIYLLGKLKFPNDSDLKHIGVGRFFIALVSLAFTIYLIPGLWGAPLKVTSAFAPPLWTQDFNLFEGAVHPQYSDYEEGMAAAKKQKKPVIIDFSGYGCVNCRKMEAAVWSDPRVKDLLDNQYVLITLMVDDKTNLPEPIEVEENGRKAKLKTIGDKWSYFQRYKFSTNSQPFYVLLDHDGKPVGPSYAYNEDIDAYLEFLNNGLTVFAQGQAEK